MKRIIAYCLIILNVFALHGVVKSDSIEILFPVNKFTLDTTLNDMPSINSFFDNIVKEDISPKIDSVTVRGFASPDGPFLTNDRLATKRGDFMADYISQRTGVTANSIRTLSGCIAWDKLRSLVLENSNTPHREDVIRILNKYIPAACSDATENSRCKKCLMAIDNGRTYNWMLRNLFPKLRYSSAVFKFTPHDESAEIANRPSQVNIDTASSISSFLIENELIAPSDLSFSETTAETDSLPSITSSPFHRLALKTNLLYYCALLPNLELEWLINKNWSVALEGNLASWGKYSRNRSYRLTIIDAEVRRWIKPRAPWHGFYVGAVAGGGWYDFQKGNGKYGEGLLAGLSGGYMWPISRSFSLEAEAAFGYLYTRYREYEPKEGHHVYLRTKKLNYYGPIKLKFSIVWRFLDANKHKHFPVQP